MKKHVWRKIDNHYFMELNGPKPEYLSELNSGVFVVKQTLFGYYLEEISQRFEFDYKLYGLEHNLIKTVQNYYESGYKNNLGVLLNGTKGTGKTVTAKTICNKLELPVIILSSKEEEIIKYINTIESDLIIFIDEYEKIFGQGNELLTYMDGVFNSQYRRVFLLTTNSLHIDRNFLDRPSRIRYLKTFGNLTPDIVENIVDDLLIPTQFKEECVSFISSLEIITVDIVKTVVQEVNIQGTSPFEFKDLFNVTTRSGKFKVYADDNTLLGSGIKLNKALPLGEMDEKSSIYINDNYVGRIKKVINRNTVDIQLNNIFEEFKESLLNSIEQPEDSEFSTNEFNSLLETTPKGRKKSEKKLDENKVSLDNPFVKNLYEEFTLQRFGIVLPEKGIFRFRFIEDVYVNDVYRYDYNSSGYPYSV